jgi:hypothetical protein
MRAQVMAGVDTGSKATAVLLGGVAVALALAVAATSMTPGAVMSWVQDVFGVTFIALFVGLILASLVCWAKLVQRPGDRVWLQSGLQAANALTTLALTFTLFGISLGIGSLAEQNLTPETVQQVVRSLTERFSLAFMTTVAGLPASAALRTLLLITHARQQADLEDAQAHVQAQHVQAREGDLS